MIAIGIDIGGTLTKIGVVEADQGCLFKQQFRTTDYSNPQDFLRKITDQVMELRSAFSKVPFEGIGIGVPGVEEKTGKILASENISWLRGFDLANKLAAFIPCKVRLINDANACALGELQFGAAKGVKNFIMITLGTGLGGAIVVNGQIILGDNGMAGEIGHINVQKNGRACNCGRRGCLETYVSATGVRRTAFEIMAESSVESPLREIPFHQLEALTIAQAAKEGDPIALEVFIQTGQVLGGALADLVAIFDPEAIIMAGGLAKAGELLFQSTQGALKASMINNFPKTVQLKYSSMDGAVAAISGAASLFLNQEVIQYA